MYYQSNMKQLEGNSKTDKNDNNIKGSQGLKGLLKGFHNLQTLRKKADYAPLFCII